MAFNCPKCGKEIITTAHVCDIPYSTSGTVFNTKIIPVEIQNIINEWSKDRSYSVVRFERLIDFIKTGK